MQGSVVQSRRDCTLSAQGCEERATPTLVPEKSAGQTSRNPVIAGGWNRHYLLNKHSQSPKTPNWCSPCWGLSLHRLATVWLKSSVVNWICATPKETGRWPPPPKPFGSWPSRACGNSPSPSSLVGGDGVRADWSVGFPSPTVFLKNSRKCEDCGCLKCVMRSICGFGTN